jgi:hypothetical protein
VSRPAAVKRLRPEPAPPRSRWWRLIIPFTVGLVLSAGYVVFVSPSSVRGNRVEVVIPQGAAQLARFGLPLPTIPEGMTFRAGDTLVVRNQDWVGHRIGPFFVPAGTSLAVPLDRPGTLSYSCTFLPGRSLGIVVRPADRLSLVRSILFFGMPVGVALSVIVHLQSRRRRGGIA